MTQTAYADFGVSDTTKDVNDNIVDLLVHQRNVNDSMNKLGWRSRQDVIDDISDRGISYMTITINTSATTWTKGADIHVVTMANGRQYLRTDRNKTPKDNLDEL